MGKEELQQCGNYVTSLCQNLITRAMEWPEQIEIPQNAILALLSILRILEVTVSKFRTLPELLTPVHGEFVRACYLAKAYHIPLKLLEQPIYDICHGPLIGWTVTSQQVKENICAGMDGDEYLNYWYYGGLCCINLKEYEKAFDLLMMALIASVATNSPLLLEAHKKYILLGLLLNGTLPHVSMKFIDPRSIILTGRTPYELKEPSSLPVSQQTRRRRGASAAGGACGPESPAPVPMNGADETAPIKKSFIEQLEAKLPEIKEDGNGDLAMEAITAMKLKKVVNFSNTFLTLSLEEMEKKVHEGTAPTGMEDLLFEMVSKEELMIQLDQSTGIVHFIEPDDITQSKDILMGEQLEGHLKEILDLTKRINYDSQKLAEAPRNQPEINQPQVVMEVER